MASQDAHAGPQATYGVQAAAPYQGPAANLGPWTVHTPQEPKAELTQSDQAAPPGSGPVTHSEAVPVQIVRNFWEDVRDYSLQILGLIFGVVFGAWTILSCQVAQQANAQSVQANMIAMAAICTTLGKYDVVSHARTL